MTKQNSKADYISVKDLAAKLNISSQAVYKRLSTDLQPFKRSIKGQTMLTVDVLEHVGVVTDPETIKPDVNPVDNHAATVDNQLQSVIDALQKQLEVKDKQIERLQTENERHSQHEREISVILADLQKNQQLLLNKALQAPEPETIYTDQDNPEEPKKKKRFKWF